MERVQVSVKGSEQTVRLYKQTKATESKELGWGIIRTCRGEQCTNRPLFFREKRHSIRTAIAIADTLESDKVNDRVDIKKFHQ